jgi:chaperone modulatory protein CbpM
MIGSDELVAAIAGLDADALHRWIDLGWILPFREKGTPRFADADVARVRLICELHYDLRIGEDSLPVILSLMDQLYHARHSLKRLVAAIEAEPADVRNRIIALVDADGNGPGSDTGGEFS